MLHRFSSSLAVLLALGSSPHLCAAEPLHERIDALIAHRANAETVPLAGPAQDGEFLRRVWLDLAGRVPPVEVTRAFLADTDPAKRTKMIDGLLNGPDYAPRLADAVHVMLMERLGDNPLWNQYLLDAFTRNKPFDQMAREILRADFQDEANRGAAFFFSKRLENYGQNPVEYSALTRDVGRLFLGKNFQCCECHDHLFIDEYKQQDFQGLHAFIRNTMLVDAATLHVGEKPTTDKLGYASVFEKVMMSTGPALPGMMMIEVPMFAKGMEFAVLPDKKTKNPGVPKFRTLAALGEQLPRATNKDFTRNAANRLWFLMMGRGIVHPLDLHHSANPPAHPELLTLLANEFAAHQFDIKWFLRELTLSQTYQRSSRAAKGQMVPDPWFFATANEKRLSAEQMLHSMLEATGTDRKSADAVRAKFLKAYANQPREPEDDIEPSLRAALFVSHDETVLALLKPKTGNLVDRAAKLTPNQAVEELYLAILSRKPTADEVDIATKFLTKYPDGKPDAVGRLAWALLASMEFGVNH